MQRREKHFIKLLEATRKAWNKKNKKRLQYKKKTKITKLRRSKKTTSGPKKGKGSGEKLGSK